MKKYIIEVSMEKHRNALSKAKSDVLRFAKELMYQDVELFQIDNKFKRLLSTNYILRKKFKNVDKNDYIFIQYPTYMGRRFERKMIEYLHKKGARLITLIHDIDYLRFNDDKFPSLAEVVEQLNSYDVVISSNQSMTDLLEKNGLRKPVVNLGIFDYFHEQNISKNKKNTAVFNFAGNLTKSKFLYEIKVNENSKINLFGNIDKNKILPNNFKYNGSFDPDVLPRMFIEGYGLVWDGDSATKMAGPMGLYQLYNNPHKVSLYLSSGLPVILWKDAALAPLIRDNNLGILVDTLDNLDETVSQVSDSDYLKMVQSCLSMSQKLKKGYFTKTAIEKAESIIQEETGEIKDD
ncbi:hypothetical protein [Paucilactobacillus suebicus]|uniref:Beta-1,6-galactofuranosyltransferase n=2 Tax=Paucilactobacillus suebicus TaxID=152335 RepID=A0A0R1W6I0_9LACO|nr:hypothetical protein [Paucilactobacillus suebicus]KRM13271.1 hypothetical protein FD16_GL000745 [Paucilactobacillus suebicus DSM 5007 = KCTC 3549]